MQIVGKKAKCFAPASVGNVIVGFDLLGFAAEGIGDIITVERISEPTVKISQASGAAQVPSNPVQNTATVGLLQMIKDLNLKEGFSVSIEKGIPLGSGMGGSAASAVGAVVAANSLLSQTLPAERLLHYALAGESVASGSAHLDNIAPSMFGGLTLVVSNHPAEIIQLPFPESVFYVLVHPKMRLDTKEARGVLKPDVPLKKYVEQSALMAGFLAGCFRSDLGLISRTMKDVLIEPQRAHLIPGFKDVKASAMSNGAIGCSIAGAGPSVFAWASSKSQAEKIRQGMVESFQRHQLESESWISPIRQKGAELLT